MNALTFWRGQGHLLGLAEPEFAEVWRQATG